MIQIDLKSKTPIYKQLTTCIANLIDQGELKPEQELPSMNSLSSDLEISKETIKKAYYILREKGVINSAHGKGFYVSRKSERPIRILVLFDFISTYKKELYESFSSNIENAEITIRLHNQDIDLFEKFIQENLEKFDYFVITAHLPLVEKTQKRAVSALKSIPNRKLLLLDRLVPGLPGNFASVYQDFESDVFFGLSKGLTKLRSFEKLNVFAMPGSLYASLLQKGIHRFCQTHSIEYAIYNRIDEELIKKNQVYLILNGQLDKELINIVKKAEKQKLKIGKDIGVISYNESPINEIVLNGLTVLSTDFIQMGVQAARMISSNKFAKVKCDFRLIERNTF